MESIISALIGGAVAVITCLINNNVQRTKEQHAIEMQIASINANYDKKTALITQQINELSERVNKHNNLIERMYKCEDRLNIIEHDISDIKDDIK
jgi:peptidoglycan hydrolase CwlO-like protein